MKPYSILPDGTIHILTEHQDALRELFAQAGVDIRDVKTEEDFTKAHTAAGDALFGELFTRVEDGDHKAEKALQHFAKGELSDFKATLARETFEVVKPQPPSEPESPDR